MNKKILAALLAVCMLASLMFVPASAAGFDDVTEQHWAKEAIDRWTEYGVLQGVGGNNFSPDRPMKRAEFARMMVNIMGYTNEGDVTFTDIDDHWAKKDMKLLAAAGVMNGTGNGKASPESYITFNQAALMLCRATGLTGSAAEGDTADKAIEKLTELDMMDDMSNFVNGMEFNRAGVAGLANNIIATYVTMDNIDDVTEGGIISGEVPGVIVVREGVRVELKDATVAAPVLVQGGEVALTGETTVPSVKVGGENATVKAEEGTTVGAVTVEGTDANVELNGEVESVTVTENATVAELGGEGVSKDIVTNESAADVEVNGETVEGKPVEEKPDEPGESTGFVPSPSVYTTTTPTDEEVAAPEAAKKDDEGNDIPVCGTKDKDGKLVAGAAASHTWVLKTNHATCIAAGDADYECSTCGATTTVTDGAPALGHQQANFAAKAPTCVNYGWSTGIECGRSGCGMNHTGITAGTTAPDFKADNTWFTKPSAISPTGNHVDNGTKGNDGTVSGDPDNKCDVCDKDLPEAHAKHEAAEDAAWQSDESGHWHACKTENCDVKVGFTAHTWGKGVKDGTITCPVCSATKKCSLKDGHTNLWKGEECTECKYVGEKTHECVFKDGTGTVTTTTEGGAVSCTQTCAYAAEHSDASAAEKAAHGTTGGTKTNTHSASKCTGCNTTYKQEDGKLVEATE